MRELTKEEKKMINKYIFLAMVGGAYLDVEGNWWNYPLDREPSLNGMQKVNVIRINDGYTQEKWVIAVDSLSDLMNVLQSTDYGRLRVQSSEDEYVEIDGVKYTIAGQILMDYP